MAKNTQLRQPKFPFLARPAEAVMVEVTLIAVGVVGGAIS
jgi:hypothetical protein